MIEFRNLTKKRIRRKIFKKLGGKMFKKNFEVSVVFAPPRLMLALNRKCLGKKTPANALSFLLERGRGEIFLNVREKNLPYLFVHSALHLLGFDHRSEKDAKIMEEKELSIIKSK